MFYVMDKFPFLDVVLLPKGTLPDQPHVGLLKSFILLHFSPRHIKIYFQDGEHHEITML